MFRPSLPFAVAVAAVALVAQPRRRCHAQEADRPVFSAPFGPDGKWHLYRLESVATFPEAVERAKSMRAPFGQSAVPGHVVTVTSREENIFLQQILGLEMGWIGLTDAPEFGGTSAGWNPRRGWVWITGEPLDFASWRPAQPDDWRQEGAGEDAAAAGPAGKWSDAGISLRGQRHTALSWVVEWDTDFREAPKGTTPLVPMLDDRLPWPGFVPEKWSVALFPLESRVECLRHALDKIRRARPVETLAVDELIVSFESEHFRPHTFLHKTDELPALTRGQSGASLSRTRIQLATAGTVSVLVAADEAFACRIPGATWRNVSGDAVIDPLDVACFTAPIGADVCRGAATVDLAAGEHTIEVAHFSSTGTAAVEVLAASGSHRADANFDGWRPIGREKAPNWPVPGLASGGWSVRLAPAGQRGLENVAAAATTLEGLLADAQSQSSPVLHFADPDGSASTLWADPTPFPGDSPGLATQWGMLATATLVIPADGRYVFGLTAHDGAALRIKGHAPSGATFGLGGSAPVIVGERVLCEGLPFREQGRPISAVWTLKKGSYPLEVIYCNSAGAAWLTVFGGAEGFPCRLLGSAPAGLEEDLSGVPLAAAPASR